MIASVNSAKIVAFVAAIESWQLSSSIIGADGTSQGMAFVDGGVFDERRHG